MAVGKAISTFKVTNPKELPKAADPAAGRVGVLLGQAIAGLTPVGETGDLRRGWRIAVEGDGRRIVFNEVPYVLYVEFGTRYQRAAAMAGRGLAEMRTRRGIT